MIHFTINGQAVESSEAQVSVAWLLDKAGVDTADAELARTTTGESWKEPTATVNLHEGDEFVTKGPTKPEEPTIRYTVNGEPQTITESPVTVEYILRTAGANAAIDLGQLESYYLDNVRTGERYENLGDEVPVADGDQFVALHAGKTPVA